MIYPHQKKAIDYITQKFTNDPKIDSLLICGSIAHGFNDEYSDIDINIVISNSLYQEREKNRSLTYWESAELFYPSGYFDGKYITLEYLSLAAKEGNEPTRFALHDSIIAFDKTNTIKNVLNEINNYPLGCLSDNIFRFLSQILGWKWYCEEAIKKNNKFLLDISITKFILFIGRLILLDNKVFFPYHKWFLKVLETVPDKPQNLLMYINKVLENKTLENIEKLYELVIKYKDWTKGQEYKWSSYFVNDIELNWMKGNEYIENI